MCYYAAAICSLQAWWRIRLPTTTLHLSYGVGSEGWIDRKWSRGVHGVSVTHLRNLFSDILAQREGYSTASSSKIPEGSSVQFYARKTK
jgi:hypothetical protein